MAAAEIDIKYVAHLARLIEVAAFQTKLKMSGHNAAQELNDRLIAHMSQGNPPPAE